MADVIVLLQWALDQYGHSAMHVLRSYFIYHDHFSVNVYKVCGLQNVYEY